MIPRLRNPSLLLTMSLVVIGAVVSVMLLQTSYRYLTTESRLKQQLEHELRLSTESLQTNVSGFLAAYAVNEYEVLVHTEMTRRNAYAIVIEDYKMGQILGTTAYISGKIRDDDLNIVEYGPDNPAHVKRLQDCCYSTGRDIVDESGRRLGHLQVYISNQNIRAQLADIINRSAVEAASIALLLILSLFLSGFHLHRAGAACVR